MERVNKIITDHCKQTIRIKEFTSTSFIISRRWEFDYTTQRQTGYNRHNLKKKVRRNIIKVK